MTELSLRFIASAMGGVVSSGQVLAPGPGHSSDDRSLSIKISPSIPNGFIVHSFSGDGFQECRDYVRTRLGLAAVGRIPNNRSKFRVLSDDRSRIERAREIWNSSLGPRGSLVEKYLRGRALQIPDDIACPVLRFNPACPWRDETLGKTIFVPAMIVAMRSIADDQITAIQRTRLNASGLKVDRRMLGVSAGAAIKLDSDDVVIQGLTVGEGFETALTARQLGIAPVWALGSSSSIATFPVIAGIGCLTILAENDAASAKAVRECARRWHQAGRQVLINRPKRGIDLNDALRETA